MLKPGIISLRLISLTCLRACVGTLCLLSFRPAMAWGPVAHGIIGNAAVAALEPGTRATLVAILGIAPGDDPDDAVSRACDWPDTVRGSAEWAWSAPLHYVNLPRHSAVYDRQRDCPDGMCVTEVILKYAAELGRPGLGPSRRARAFAWLCHLVGDLHQPLHAGFRDDLGGNRVDVLYRGERANLHQFWDSVLVKERLDAAGGALPAPLVPRAASGASRWQPSEVIAWTEESHALALTRAYPPDATVSEEFAAASWNTILGQWQKAAARLARILGAVLDREDSPGGG